MLFVTIDFDFFVLVRGTACEPFDRITIHPGTEREEDIPACYPMDWGHSERVLPSVQGAVWGLRAHNLASLGIDPTIEVNIRPDLGLPTPGDLVKALLRRRFKLTKGKLYVSDSHGHAVATIHDLRRGRDKPIDVLMFDAHCDLGYHSDEFLQGMLERHQCEAGSWLWLMLETGRVRHATIVYPDWKGLSEWVQMSNRPHIQKHIDAGRIRALTWSDWLRGKGGSPQKVACVHACRSGAWTPPWTDPAFNQMVTMLGGVTNAKPRLVERVIPDCGPPYPDEVRDLVEPKFSNDRSLPMSTSCE